MDNKSTYLLGILLTIIAGSLLYCFLYCGVCYKKETCSTNKKTQEKTQENIARPNIKEPTFISFVLKMLMEILNFQLMKVLILTNLVLLLIILCQKKTLHYLFLNRQQF